MVRVVNPKKQRKGKHELTLEEAGQLDHLLSATRTAVNEFSPTDPPRVPFLYWGSGRDPKSKLSAIKLLMKRHPQFAEEAHKYASPRDYMEKFAPSVRVQANNERSTQIRTMKETWLAKDSPFCFAHGCLDFVKGSHPEAPTILARGTKGEFEDVRALQKALVSSTMYTHPNLFDKWCGGIESGNFRLNAAHPRAKPSTYLTVAHEAHFRLEMWYALKHYGYQHPINMQHNLDRREKWKICMTKVKQDRENNEREAFQKRQAASGTENASNAIEESSSSEEDAIDQEFW